MHAVLFMPFYAAKVQAGLPHFWKRLMGVSMRASTPYFYLCTASLLALCTSYPVHAQAQQPPGVRPAPAADAAKPDELIDFAADTLEYDTTTDIIRAQGSVIMQREGYTLEADRVEYDRKTGLVTATGNVRVSDPEGNVSEAETLTLTDRLRDGIVDNLRLFLTDGSRLAALSGQRNGEDFSLNRAVYTPCMICVKDGRERPFWQIRAVKVERDGAAKRIRYTNATLEFFNVPVAFLPFLSHPDPSEARASGFLVPDFAQTRALGVSVSIPYYFALSPSRDLTLKPTLYTGERPLLESQYRQRFTSGEIQLDGSITYSPSFDQFGLQRADENFRGHIFARGTFNHSAQWRSTLQVNLTTDDTFLRRYDFSNDDTLRSLYRLERIGAQSYLVTNFYAFQSLRRTNRPGLAPVVLPQISYFWDGLRDTLGGRFSLQGHASSILRTNGQDNQRLIGLGQYEVPFLNTLGMRFTGTARLRGDVFNVNQSDRPDDPNAAGQDGVTARLLPLASVEVRWPLGAPGFGGFQTLEPVFQLTATSQPNNVSKIPNEDSRSIDLDETNLFSLNRFTGFDRYEGGIRATYGTQWRLDRGQLQIDAQIGQSYRLDPQTTAFPIGTGLSGRFSDIVGRTEIRFANFVDVIHRYRIDKNSLAFRRNEIDTVLKRDRWELAIGYSSLNRNLVIEDLEDREELRISGRVRIAKFWNLSASTIQDLSGGSQPIRNTFGIEYNDECIRIGITYRKNFTEDRDFRRGTTILFRIALRNLG
jgi:LPS-assembly protein